MDRDRDGGPDPIELMQLYTFDSHDEGFQAEGDGWTHNAREGTMDGVLEYTEPYESTYIQKMWSNGIYFSEALELEVTLRINEAVTGGFQLFIKTGPDSRTPEELSLLLEKIESRTVGELQKLYEELSGEETRSRNRPSLIKRVTACIQERLEQRPTEVATSSRQVAPATKQKPPRPKSRHRDPRLPAPGTVLTRECQGALHEVTVLEECFTYNEPLLWK
jgi:hypothetical protein